LSGVALFLSVEAGWKWTLSDKLSLYTGAYLDYGLNNIAASTGDFMRISAEGISTGSIVATEYLQGKRFVKNVAPVSAGVKVSLAFGASRNTLKEASAESKRFDDIDWVKKSDEDIADQKRKQQEFAEARERQAAVRADSIKQVAEVRKAEEVRQQEVRKQEEQRQYVAAVIQVQQPIAEYTLNSAEPSEASKADLQNKADLLKRYPDTKVIIEGHTCNLGIHEVNVEIGQRRAEAAKAYLIERGVAPDRIQTVSKAETEPLAPNTNEENRRKNRRVEIKIIGDK
jgi:outer membrane protein OmpA-like peptidoglycan-associated protein